MFTRVFEYRLLWMLFVIAILLMTACSSDSNINKTTDHYNFDEEQTLKNLGNFQLSLSEDRIIFSNDYPKITEPLRYEDSTDFNFNKIYKLKNSASEVYYFRFNWIRYKDHQNELENITWLKEKPSDDDFQDYLLFIVNIPFLQKGNIKTCTIGDSQTWWAASGSLRKLMNEEYSALYFTGSDTDRFGYPHEGEGGNSSQQVLDRMHKIPEAQFYTLLLGTNDWKNEVETSVENIKILTDFLQKKYPEATILYLTPLPTTNKKRDEFNRELMDKLIIKFEPVEAIKIIQLRKAFEANNDWAEDYLGYDGLHPDENGVELMTKTITDFLKEEPQEHN